MHSIEILLNDTKAYVNESGLPVNFEEVYRFHQSMEAYEKTPLHHLKALTERLHVKGIYVKDESYRFGLNAFKGLGVSYALHEIIKNNAEKKYTFVSCTDGNHGKALAWRADQLGHEAIIFMPKGSEIRRVKAIEAYNAKVYVTEMNYDDTVRFAAQFAKEHGYYLIQDTALPDYTDIPNHIALGYSTMIQEALKQLAHKPTHVFLQAGVGSMAGGVLWYLYNAFGEELPFVGVIESSSVACIYESVRQNELISIGGEPYTIMAGLNCGEPNFLTFPLLKAKCQCFIKCQDEITVLGMERAKNPLAEDILFSAGESGAVGLGLVEAILSSTQYENVKEQLNINGDSVILVFNTEGELKSE